MKKLKGAELQALLSGLPEWAHNAAEGSIRREFVFADFKQAWGFMSQVALMAEQRNHHPEWSNVYQRVTIVWTTHDVGGLSMNDIEAARFCDQVGR